MSRVKRFFASHRVCFGLFVFVMAYQILVGNNLAPWRLNEHFITFYTVDYGMGFCSRFLPGAVYRLFFDQVNVSVLSAFSSAFLVLFFLALCFLLERVLLQAPRKEQTVCLFMILLFISGPASFTLFVKWLGVIDVYWIYLCLLFVFALANRRAWFLIPVIFIVSVLVHYGVMICYVPMMAIMLLYRLLTAEEKKDRAVLTGILLSSLCLAAGLTVYFILFERRNLIYSMDEFNTILLERGAKYTYYYDYNLYRNFSSAGDQSFEGYIYGSGSPLVTFARSVWMQIRTTLAVRIRAGFTVEYVLSVLLICPAAVLMLSVFFSRFREEKGAPFFRRAVYLLAPLLFLGSFAASTLFSSDTYRWVAHTFLPLIAVFLYFGSREGERFWNAARRKIAAFPVPVLAAYLIVYAAVVAVE